MAALWDAVVAATRPCESCGEPFEASYDDQAMCPACVNADLPDDDGAEVYVSDDKAALAAYMERSKREGDNFGELLKVLRRVK